MKRYLVDLRSLSPEKREAAYELIDNASFVTSMVLGDSGLEYADVYWTSSEDFVSSPVFPRGCTYREIHSNE